MNSQYEAMIEMDRLRSQARIEGDKSFIAGSMRIRCVYWQGEFNWFVASKLATEETTQRVIAQCLAESPPRAKVRG